jgi:hypothetical protein
MELLSETNEIAVELNRIIDEYSAIISTIGTSKEHSTSIMSSTIELEKEMNKVFKEADNVIDELKVVTQLKFLYMPFLGVKLPSEQNEKLLELHSLKAKATNRKVRVNQSLNLLDKKIEQQRKDDQITSVKNKILAQTQEIVSLFDELVVIKKDLETLTREKQDYSHLEKEFKALQVNFQMIKLQTDFDPEVRKQVKTVIDSLKRSHSSLKKEVNILSNRFSVLAIRETGSDKETAEKIRCPVCKKLITKGSDLCNYCGARLTSTTKAVTDNLCPSCGKDITSCKSFCKHCGAKIETPSTPSTPVSSSTSATDLLTSRFPDKPPTKQRSTTQPSVKRPSAVKSMVKRQVTGSMVECSACGEEISKELTFCNHCGTRQE